MAGHIVGWSTVSNFVDVMQLPKLLINGVTVLLQGHHVIPQNVFNTFDFFTALKQNGLFDGNSFKTNGLALPGTAVGGDVVGSAHHAGAHQAYSDWIKDRLIKFEADYRTGNFGGLSQIEWLKQSAAEVHGLVGYAKTELMNPSSSMSLVRGNLAPEVLDATLRQDFATRTWDVIKSSHAFEAAIKLGNGAAIFDATPGSGSALDSMRGLTQSNLASAVADEVGLAAKAAASAPEGAIVKFLYGPGATALKVLGTAGTIYDIFTSSAEAADQINHGDVEGAALTMTRLAARLVVGLKAAAVGAQVGFVAGGPVGAVAGGLAGGVFGTVVGDDAVQAIWGAARATANLVLGTASAPLAITVFPNPEAAQLQQQLIDAGVPPAAATQAVGLALDEWLAARRTNPSVTLTEVLQRMVGDVESNRTAQDLSPEVTAGITASSPQLDGSVGTIIYDESGATRSTIERGNDGSIHIDEFDATDQQAWSQRTVLTDANGNIVERTTTVSANGHDALARTTWNYNANGELVGNPQQQVEIPRVGGLISASSIGSLLGSSLGQAIGGGNIFTQLAAGTALSAILGNLGRSLDGFLRDTNLASAGSAASPSLNDAALGGIDIDLANAFRAQSVMAISSFLTGELAQALGFDGTGFGDQLLRATTGSLLGSALNSIAQWTLPGPASNVFDTILGNPLIGVGTFLGRYLAGEIIDPTNTVGAIGGSFGGALGGLIGTSVLIGSVGAQIATSLGFAAAVGNGAGLVLSLALPGVGAFVGALIGTLIGDFLGDVFGPDPPSAHADLTLLPGDPEFHTAGHDGSNSQVLNPLVSMRLAAINVLNDVVKMVGGQLVGGDFAYIGFRTEHGTTSVGWSYASARSPDVPGGQTGNGHPAHDMVEYAVIQVLKHIEIAGGNLYMKRALAHTTATTLEQLAGELKIAEDYGRYLASKEVIDALIAQYPNSAFAAGWIVTLLQAEALGITQMGKSDFYGGVAAFLESFDLQRFGATLNDISFVVDRQADPVDCARRGRGATSAWDRQLRGADRPDPTPGPGRRYDRERDRRRRPLVRHPRRRQHVRRWCVRGCHRCQHEKGRTLRLLQHGRADRQHW